MKLSIWQKHQCLQLLKTFERTFLHSSLPLNHLISPCKSKLGKVSKTIFEKNYTSEETKPKSLGIIWLHCIDKK